MGILGTSAGSRKKDRKKKPDELLSSVVRETAIPAAVELLRSNPRFVFPSGTAWVMLVLAAEEIGGLSKRHGRDEAKGSIIELIGSDQIKTVATPEMLAEDVFGIIPTEDTLERMAEYSLLTGATYAWAVAWHGPSGELLVDLVQDATFAQAREVAAGVTTLEEAIGEQAWREHSGISWEEPPTTAGPWTQSTDDEDAVFDWVDEDDHEHAPAEQPSVEIDVEDEEAAATGSDDAPGWLDDEDAPAGPSAEPEYGTDEPSGFEEDDDAGTEEDDGEEPMVLLADEEEVREVIARRFLSEDLDLDVRLDEFDATFAIGAPVVQIAVPEGATEWLGDQVAQLNRQANADLARLRHAHEDELRTLFVTLMSAHVEQVIRDVATDREGSRYKALRDEAERAHRERQGEKEQRIRARKAEIAQDHDAQARRLAEQAAIQAEIQYKERHRSKMNREQADAAAEIERILENAHSHDRQEILRVRRSDAALKMQAGTTRIFEVLAERQSEYLTAEEQRLAEWKAEVQGIVDDNRKADIAQYEALAEHQRTTDEIGALRREQDALVESLRSEHAERIRRLEEELERSRKDAVTAMQGRDEEWQHSLHLERAKTDSQTQRVTDLLTQVETVEASVVRRYEARLVEMQTDKDSYANELARASEIQSRSNKILVVLLVALSLLSGVAGFIGGAALGG